MRDVRKRERLAKRHPEVIDWEVSWERAHLEREPLLPFHSYRRQDARMTGPEQQSSTQPGALASDTRDVPCNQSPPNSAS